MSSKIKFTKMQGLGNDFVFVGSPKAHFSPDTDFIRSICHRKYGIGADGLVTITASAEGDYFMRIFNPDGTEAEMCGNALRCSARYVVRCGYSGKSAFSVQTVAGIRKVRITENGSECSIGTPKINGAGSIFLEGHEFEYFSVSTGNPHCVIFCRPLDDDLFLRCGAAAERHPFFPNGANAEFCTVLHNGEILMRVWERGVGETLSCATGSGAAAYTAFTEGLCGNETRVRQPGGVLDIRIDAKGEVFASGECIAVFCGEY